MDRASALAAVFGGLMRRRHGKTGGDGVEYWRLAMVTVIVEGRDGIGRVSRNFWAVGSEGCGGRFEVAFWK